MLYDTIVDELPVRLLGESLVHQLSAKLNNAGWESIADSLGFTTGEVNRFTETSMKANENVAEQVTSIKKTIR